MTEEFEGVWRLARWSVVGSDSEKEYLPFEGAVDGYLVYTREGWVTASLMQRSRAPVCDDRLQLRKMCDAVPADEQLIEQVWQWFLAGFGYVSYCGRFEVHNEQVHHHIETSLVPQWVGTTLTRDVRWNKDKSELQLLASGEILNDRLLWQRFG